MIYFVLFTFNVSLLTFNLQDFIYYLEVIIQSVYEMKIHFI